MVSIEATILLMHSIVLSSDPPLPQLEGWGGLFGVSSGSAAALLYILYSVVSGS